MKVSGSLHLSRELRVSEAEKIGQDLPENFNIKSGIIIEADGEVSQDIVPAVARFTTTIKDLGLSAHGIIDVTENESPYKLISLGKLVRKMDVKSKKFSSV